MQVVFLSPGSTLTVDDVAEFDRLWMHPDHQQDEVWAATGNLLRRNDRIMWRVTDRMTALAAMYDLTGDTRYALNLKELADCVMRYREDRHPGGLSDGVAVPPSRIDELRGRVVPGWGGPSVNRGGLNAIDEVVTSLYAFAVATCARIILENESLRLHYATEAVADANALLETVALLLRQVDFRQVDGFTEAFIEQLAVLRTRLTEQQCRAGADEALRLDPTLDADQMLTNCRNSARVAGRPLAHNENLAFAMLLIELSRVLDNPHYRSSPARSPDAEVTRTAIPLLVSRFQRYFVNHLRLDGDHYFWRHCDDIPEDLYRAEDTSHGALAMRYVSLLRQHIAHLNVTAAAAGEPIPLDDHQLQRFANTFLQKIAPGLNFARNVAGEAGEPAQNELSNGWADLAVIDGRVYHACHNTAVRVVAGAQPYLFVASHAALLRNKRFASRCLYVEGTRPFNAPTGYGAPAVTVSASLDTVSVIYRDPQKRIHELWRKGRDIGTSNVTYLSGSGPPVLGDVRPFIASDGLMVALYRGSDRHVHSLYWSTADVGHDALSRAANAPVAAGDPMGFVQRDGTNVVIYRTLTGTIRSLWWRGGDRPETEDLTAPSGFPAATGTPVPFSHPVTGQCSVIYRGTDGQIHRLYWTTGRVECEHLSSVAGAPPAAGDVDACYSPEDDMYQIVYRDAQGHLRELWWIGDQPVQGRDLTPAAGPSSAASDPVVCYNPTARTKHFMYRTTSSHVVELRRGLGDSGIQPFDWTELARAPLAADRPACCTAPGSITVYCAYRGVDNEVHQIYGI